MLLVYSAVLPTSLMVFFQLMPMVVKKILTSSSSFSPSKQAGREAESLWWRKRFDQIGAAEQAVRAFGDQIGAARHPEICTAPKRNLDQNHHRCVHEEEHFYANWNDLIGWLSEIGRLVTSIFFVIWRIYELVVCFIGVSWSVRYCLLTLLIEYYLQ